MEQSEIFESAVAIDYTELLTMIYDVLVQLSDKMDLLTIGLFFIAGILAGAIVAAASVYFVGQMMRGK